MKINYVVFFLLFACSFGLQAQSLWHFLPLHNDFVPLQKDIQQFQIAHVDLNAFDKLQANIPAEFSTSPQSYQQLTLPMPDGSFQDFQIMETQIMEAPLAAKYPHFKTYMGHAIQQPNQSLRLTWTNQGIDAVIFTSEGEVFIRSLEKIEHCIVYYGKYEIGGNLPEKLCGFHGQKEALSDQLPMDSGEQLRIVRTAIAATGEYTEERGGGKENGMASIVSTSNAINGIFERDLTTRLILVADNDVLVYEDAATDPFDIDAFSMLQQNVENLNAVIGRGNYDLGHILGSNIEGGVAGVASFVGNFCSPQAGAGVSGFFGNQTRFLRTVAHEMGHQLGADHTWSNCTEDLNSSQRSRSTAVEPGSGNTLMSYAGSCGENNVINNSYPFFHGISIRQINQHLSRSAQCYRIEATGNNLPAVSISMREDVVIPIGTPFELTAIANDSDGDQLSYSWEQFDLDTISVLGIPTGDGPSFRAFSPSDDSIRILPQRVNIQLNVMKDTEVLPTYNRSFSFNVVVRDNRNGGGSVVTRPYNFTTTEEAGPFTVISPNDAATTWMEGEEIEIVWDVAHTSQSPVNCETVDILLSYNNGALYETVLASEVPNIGSAFINVPMGRTTNRARLKIQASNSIFFDISDALFSIVEGSVAVTETQEQQLLRLLPNPAQDKVWLQLDTPSAQAMQVELFDTQGRILEMEYFQNMTQSQSLDVSKLGSGVYYIRATQADKQQVQKLLIQ